MFHISQFLPSLDSTQFTDWIFYFATCACFGWIAETIYKSFNRQRFVNSGLLTGPVSPTYGFAGIIVLLISQQITFKSNELMLLTFFFAFAFIFGAMAQLIPIIGEFFTGLPWGDNNHSKTSMHILNLAVFSAIYAVLAMIYVFFVQPFLIHLIGLIPPIYYRPLASGIILLFIVDFIFTMRSLYSLKKAIATFVDKINALATPPTPSELAEDLNQFQDDRSWSEKRLLNAFPRTIDSIPAKIDAFASKPKSKRKFLDILLNRNTDLKLNEENESKKSFAHGLNLYKLLWVFTIASIIGFTIETVFCLLWNGYIESRQGFLYGPFSQIYGLGACFMVILTYPIRNKGNVTIFISTALIGGVFEAAASWVQQTFLGGISWHYSDWWTVPLFGGRTCLSFMLGWGALGIVFIRFIYPHLSRWIEDIPNHQGRVVSWILFSFLLLDAILSAMSVHRWNQREAGIPAKNEIQYLIDKAYPNQFMEQVYPNMKHTE